MTNFLTTRTSRRWALGLLLSASTFAAVAHAGLTSIGGSDIQFKAAGPAGLKIDGTGRGISVSEAGGKIKVSAPLKSLKTGISLRDKHLKDALNVKKHPTATLTVARSKLTFPDDKKKAKGQVVGKMTLNGVTRPQSFNYKVERTGSDYHVQGLAKVDITKFKIEKPCYLGVCVNENVKIKVKFKVREK